MNLVPESQKRRLGISWGMGLCLFLAIAIFLLWEEHKAHILGIAPYLLLLACPLIHIFMHRGHGHGEHGSGKPREGRGKEGM